MKAVCEAELWGPGGLWWGRAGWARGGWRGGRGRRGIESRVLKVAKPVVAVVAVGEWRVRVQGRVGGRGRGPRRHWVIGDRAASSPATQGNAPLGVRVKRGERVTTTTTTPSKTAVTDVERNK